MRYLERNRIVKRFASICVIPLAIAGIVSAIDTIPVEVVVKSPDENIVVNFNLKEKPEPYPEGERPYYMVTYKGLTIIQDSCLGMEFEDDLPLEDEFKIINVTRKNVDNTYAPIWGTEKIIRNHYNEVAISLVEKNEPERIVDLIFRVYNDGVAFRYYLPEQESLADFVITAEHSWFCFRGNWAAYALQLGSYNTAYEEEFDKTRLADIEPAALIGLPLLVEIDNGPWVAIAEAELINYAGMYLSAIGEVPNALRSKLSSSSTPHTTPWRVVMIGSSPGDLIESNIILNLNRPCVLKDTSWIKPGKAVWSWWSGRTVRGVDFKGGMNTPTMKYYIDFAGKHKFEYLLIDAGWYGNHRDPREDITTPIEEINIQEIVDYANQHAVGVLLWLNWQCVRNQMAEAFALYEKWGIAGVKVDYMNRDDQEMVNFYHEVASKAAEHHLVLDFHGAYKPTGLRRTYPNILTREGIKGLEHGKRVTPEHNVTIPFTRMLAGPMDYTPGCFDLKQRGGILGTRCHQLAMYVVYESPLQMVVDYPSAYEGQAGFKFLEDVPTTWDHTRVLNGKVGEYITIARKCDGEWYVGSMTDEEARTLTIPLDFLGKGKYQAEIYSDGQGPVDVVIGNRIVTSTDTIVAKLASGGGQAIRMIPLP